MFCPSETEVPRLKLPFIIFLPVPSQVTPSLRHSTPRRTFGFLFCLPCAPFQNTPTSFLCSDFLSCVVRFGPSGVICRTRIEFPLFVGDMQKFVVPRPSVETDSEHVPVRKSFTGTDSRSRGVRVTIYDEISSGRGRKW